jgi:elongation factor P--beta-lysine ligase
VNRHFFLKIPLSDAHENFFLKKDFIEIATPSLVVCTGTEPSLEVYKTIHIQGRHSREFFSSNES